jgi:uncharacterized membrane protein (DUF106 family)
MTDKAMKQLQDAMEEVRGQISPEVLEKLNEDSTEIFNLHAQVLTPTIILHMIEHTESPRAVHFSMHVTACFITLMHEFGKTMEKKHSLALLELIERDMAAFIKQEKSKLT